MAHECPPPPADEGNVFGEVWDAFESGGLIVQCAWCKAVRIGEDWVAAPLSVFSAIDARLSVSHSICPDCTAIAGAELAERTA
jgi:hypothetical protein